MIPGTLNGAASFMPGQGIDGGAISLAASGNGYVTMGNVLAFDGSQAYTVSCWVRLETAPTNQFPVAKHTATVVAGYFLCVHPSGGTYGAPERAFFYDGHAPGSEALGTTDVNDNTWHHIVGVRIPGQGKRIYIDGVLEDTAPLGNSNVTTAPLMLGGLFVSGNPTGVYTGMIDDVQIYDEALADADVLFLHQNPGLIVCRGDLDGDNDIDTTDLNVLLSEFGCTSGCTADFDGDGDVDTTDLNVILANFAVVCEP
jgi:hypothetical protein